MLISCFIKRKCLCTTNYYCYCYWLIVIDIITNCDSKWSYEDTIPCFTLVLIWKIQWAHQEKTNFQVLSCRFFSHFWANENNDLVLKGSDESELIHTGYLHTRVFRYCLSCFTATRRGFWSNSNEQYGPTTG